MARVAVTARIMEGGRIVLPAPFRKALCLKPGDQVIVECDDTGIRISSRLTGIRRAQALVRPWVEGTPSMADELIAERRAEAEAEAEAGD